MDYTSLKHIIKYLNDVGIEGIFTERGYEEGGDRNKHPIGELEELNRSIEGCTRCGLHKERKRIVFGTGDPLADIIFVGEAPGEEEDIKGEPFVGKAGNLLTSIIENAMKIKRDSVYICNVVKCRPPLNREPKEEEIASCIEFLKRQIDIIKPKIIVALGKIATSTLLGKMVSINEIRGKWMEFNSIPVMPTFHPAYILRNYSYEVRQDVFNDVMKVIQRLKG